jgi:exportin-1
LSCLTEVFSHDAEERQVKSIETFYTFIIEFFYTRIIGQSFDIQMAYINGGQESINFFQNFSFFLSSFFKIYVNILERHIHIHCDLLNGLEMLIKLSYLKDIEIFKSCIDFWRNFAYELYIKHITTGISHALESEKDKSNQWQLLYGTVMRELRLFIIQNMTKPEEVFVTIDENGNVKREIFNNSSHDLDVLAQHKTMQETLKYLTYLNYVETHQIMIDKISLQLNEHDWARETLNTLCWAIGAISGSVGNLEAENKFLVSVIKYLLNLCEKVKGKDNKAVVASNIMYVVGQYPKFLNNNWKFLKTVVIKLFEFMNECHPGIKDMACDTFAKIVQRCVRRFVTVNSKETMTFIEEILQKEDKTSNLSRIRNFTIVMRDLEPQQRLRFYETLALILHNYPEKSTGAQLLEKLMEPANKYWDKIIEETKFNKLAVLKKENYDILKDVLHINLATCTSLRSKFLPQIKRNHHDMLEIYLVCSELADHVISEELLKGTSMKTIIKFMDIDHIRAIKKLIIRLIERFGENCELSSRTELLSLNNYLILPILQDYWKIPIELKDYEILSCLSAIIKKVGKDFIPYIHYLENTFEVTYGMITCDPDEYPDHRLALYTLMHAVITSCFDIFIKLSNEQMELLIKSDLYALRHAERSVAHIGIRLLWEILQRFSTEGDSCTLFYRLFFEVIINDVLFVLTDSLHKSEFKVHVKILYHLTQVVLDFEKANEQLWQGSNDFSTSSLNIPYSLNNAKKYISSFISCNFPMVKTHQTETLVDKIFCLRNYDDFLQHLEDITIITKVL